MQKQTKLRNTTVWTMALAAFLAGLGFARLRLPFDVQWVIAVGVVLGLGIFIRKKRRFVWIVACVLLGFMLGWWRGVEYLKKLAIYDDIIGKSVVMEVEATEDSVYSERGQLTFVVGDIKLLEPVQQDIIGQITIEGRGVPMVYRGDILRVEGKLFRKRGATQAGTSFATIELVSQNSTPIDDIRRSFAAGLQNSLPEPLASFGLSLLIGQRNTLSKQVNDELITTGLVHIVAVSGYNLTVIISMCRRIFARHSRYQALVFSLALISVFLLFTGYSASIVRAAIVSSVSLSLWFFGRKARPLLILLISAVLTAGYDPLMLWSNIGWYLSFTAFFGVLIVSPLLLKKFAPKSQEKIIPSVLSETLSAQLCTLPIILFIFGRLSIISIVANLMVVPVTPFAMLFSLIAGLGGMINPVLGSVVAIPARIILQYMLEMSRLLSRVPYASVAFYISAWQMVYLYILIIYTVVILQHKQKRVDKLRPKPKNHSL